MSNEIKYICPICGHDLKKDTYKGLNVYMCSHCAFAGCDCWTKEQGEIFNEYIIKY